MQVQPYLSFDGRAEEAIEFYKQALDAELVMLSRFGDSPEPPPPDAVPPGSGDKVMHAELRIGDSVVMISDGNCKGQPSFGGFSLSLVVPDLAAAERAFAALAEGGQVMMPLAKTFGSPGFGMLSDRFGVGWMVNVTPAE